MFRTNEIWRTVHRRSDGSTIGEELLKRNCAVVKYEPIDTVIDVG